MSALTAGLYRLTAALLAGTLLCTCGADTCNFPVMPPDGSYHVINADELPIVVESVTVQANQMTIRYTDESGISQFVVYELRE